MDVGYELGKIEDELDRGGRVALAEFWKVVAAAKEDREVAARFSGRIGSIDQEIFRRRVPLTLSMSSGNLLALVGVLLSLLLAVGSLRYHGQYLWTIPIVSALLLSASIHPLAHWLAGRLFRINFTFYFLDGPIKIEPTVKIDYASYLRAEPEHRAAMHLAGPAATAASPLIIALLLYLSGAPQLSFLAPIALFLFFSGTEFVPLALVKLNSLKIFGLDFRKSDTYRAYREWKLH